MRRAWVVLGAMACAGCVTSAPVRQVSPQARAMEVSRAQVGVALSEGVLASEGEESFALRLRRNPGRCGAPEFEVWAYGRWERVWLEAATDVLAGELEAWGAQVGEERVESVRFTRERRADERGAVWSVLTVYESQEVGGEVAGVEVRARRAECL